MIILNDIKDRRGAPVYFVHIPKTAGTGVSEDWSASTGHAHPLVIVAKDGVGRWQNCIRFAIFRNPWDRISSLCEYIRVTGDWDGFLRFNWMSDKRFNNDKVALMSAFLNQIEQEKNDSDHFAGETWAEADASGKHRGLWACIGVARQQVTWLKNPGIDPQIILRDADKASDWTPKKYRGMYTWKILHDHGFGFNTEGEWCIDVVLNMDQINADYGRFAGLIGVTPKPLPRKNANTSRQATNRYFDKHNDAKLREMFGDDIELLRHSRNGRGVQAGPTH
jgi:hypothetical protein